MPRKLKNYENSKTLRKYLVRVENCHVRCSQKDNNTEALQLALTFSPIKSSSL